MPQLQQAAEVAPARSAEAPADLPGRGAGAHRARVLGSLGQAAVRAALILQSLLIERERSGPGTSLLSCKDLQAERAVMQPEITQMKLLTKSQKVRHARMSLQEDPAVRGRGYHIVVSL